MTLKYLIAVLTVLLSASVAGAEISLDSPLVKDWMLQDGRTEPADADYIKACQQRRGERLKTLKETFPKIVFARHFDFGGSHYAYTEGQSDAQSERHFIAGTALCVLELNADNEYVERTLISDPNGVIRDPAVSYDGKTIIFAWKKSDRLDDYHLYDYDVESGETRQLTFGLGHADYEPCILPDGDIVFNSTRCVQTVDCWWTEVSNLYRCDKDGRFLRRLSYDQVHTNYPSILDDGRIVYTRWDYNDRGQLYPQGLFQMNPDGTGQTEFYGNNSWFPTTLMHSRGIPGTGGKVVSIFSGHHTRQYGKLGIVDITKGRQENSGTQLIAPVRETTADRVDAWGQEGDRFAYPFPINEHEFIVSYHSDQNAGHTMTTPFGIFWMAEDGRRELLAYDPKISSHQPVPLVASEKPYDRTTTVDGDVDYGTFLLQDVYFGPGMEGIERGTAKTLRVIALDFRSAGIGSNTNFGPAITYYSLVSTPISTGNGSWDVKIPLGDTPIYEDGSAGFVVPARTPLYFQVLDANGHAIQTMRSWATLQPGETFSCIGCHEEKNTVGTSPVLTEALRRGPQPLKPFYGEPRGFSFVREIQPILDAKCVECHRNANAKPAFAEQERNGDLAKMNAVAGDDALPFSLKNEPVLDASAKRYWPLSYLNLTNSRPNQEGCYSAMQTPTLNWINVQSAPSMFPPYQAGAAKSGIMRMFDPNLAENGKTHNDVTLTREELDKLAFWLDMLVPAFGDYEEGNAWDDAEKRKFEYYESKRKRLHELNLVNDRQFVAWQKGGPLPPLPEDPNPYRNLAVDVAAENGGATGHDDPLCRRIDFVQPVKIDQVVVTIRDGLPPEAGKDTGKDTGKMECTVECSNGFVKQITLQDTADRQAFAFPAQGNVTWLKLTNSSPETLGVSMNSAEIEAFGIDDK